MNRYIVQGILADLAAGRSVLLIAPTLALAAHALDAVADRAYTLSPDPGSRYRHSRANGAAWVRDETTGAAATFTSLQSGIVDHAGGDVVIVYEYRHLVDKGDTLKTEAATRRLQAIIGDRDTVVID